MRYLVCLSLLLAACNPRSPSDDYRNFRARTESARTGGCASAGTGEGALADVSGVWLIRALLNGGISLGLRIAISPADGETQIPPRRIKAEFWLAQQPDDITPLVTTEADVSEDGSFVIIADPLELGPDVLGSESTVSARVEFHAQIRDSHLWCGVAFGSVVSPLNLNLEGSTFGALRRFDGLAIEDVPFQCPGDPCALDAGTPSPDAVAETDAGVPIPARPDFQVDNPQRQDLTGDWFLQASLSGLPLKLWVALVYREGEGPDGTASVDGAIRLAADPLDQPPRLNFSSTVDAQGRFDVWLPRLTLDVNTLTVEGDILLSAAGFDDAWCGMAAGQVTSPFPIDLTGSTFGAIRWSPGTEPPEEPLTACP